MFIVLPFRSSDEIRMLLWSKPTAGTIESLLRDQRSGDLTYDAIGATADAAPAGFIVDRSRVHLGSGERCFTAARSALEQWQQFDIGWLEVRPLDAPIRTGQTLAILAHSLGLWWLNACRIVYVIDQHQPTRQFGFAYGTLAEHIAAGEERFLIELDQQDDVWYSIYAFSQPRQWLARMGYPFVRRRQKQFGRQSTQRMRRAVHERLEGPS